MNDSEQTEFRRRLGALVLTEQKIAEERGYNPVDVVPAVITSLLSLAAYIAKNNASFLAQDFVNAATAAALDEWIGTERRQ